MPPLDKTKEKEIEREIRYANQQDKNTLLNAMYQFELRAIIVLEIINAGAAALLINFTKPTLIAANKYLFFASISCFLLGLVATVLLLFISPQFMGYRYRGVEKSVECKKYSRYRHMAIGLGVGLFVTGSILALIMLTT